jgi:hypothetical protein
MPFLDRIDLCFVLGFASIEKTINIFLRHESLLWFGGGV